MSFTTLRRRLGVQTLCCLGILVGLVILLALWKSAPVRDFDETRSVRSTTFFGIGNFAVIEFAPNGQNATLRWEVFNLRDGNALNRPFERLTFTARSESYVVTDEGRAAGTVSINGKVVEFDYKTQHIRLRLGATVDVAEGADYESAIKRWDWGRP